MKEALLAAARALDDGKPEEARAILRAAPLTEGEPGLRPVALALWQRLVSMPPNEAAASAPSLKAIAAALKDGAFIWNAYEAIPVIEAAAGAGDTATLIATTLWDRVLGAHEGLFTAVFELFFRAGGERCLEAWRRYLHARKDYVPIYWHWLLLTKTFANSDRAAIAAAAAKLLADAERPDLAPLFAVYLEQMRQAPVEAIVAAALALTEPAQRRRVAEYMTGMGYMPEELPVVAAAFPQLVGDDAAGKASIAFMAARLANAQGRWRQTVEQARVAAADPRYKESAPLLRAHALARLRESANARAILDAVGGDTKAAPWLHARAMFIRVTAQLIKDGATLPEDRPPPVFAATPGRPLAQSLWVGKRLRWIERLAIKSYLDRGWRFQLYAYDEIDGVPAGCEVLSASAIIPEKEVFTEGTGSGLHAGSVGAFSDLFRYRLLYERGGMWTDTDVINFRKFDPDGRKFVATELSDAGLVSLNGAMMAAPAGDAFVARAYERAAALLKADTMFFTRIGPYLLAELVAEMGSDVVELMPPGFLSPISWMNTGSLLQPYERVAARPEMSDAVNLHVYTEMWRLLGLGLDQPPGAESFLGRLYAQHFDEEPVRR